MSDSESTAPQAELYLVFGGEVKDTRGQDFVDLEKLDTRGFFSAYEAAHHAWRAASQQNIDNAFIKYVIVRIR